MKKVFRRRPATYQAAENYSGRLKRRTWWRSKWLIIGLVIVGGVVVIILVVRALNAPAVGSLNQTPPSQAAQTSPYNQPGAYRGQYVSFSYPAHYKQVPTQLSGDYLEAVNLASSAETDSQLAIGVIKSSLASDSGVVFRERDPQLYKQTASSLGLEFSKLDGSEDTFFVQHGSLIASVSATGSGNTASDAYYVASSLHWQ